MSSQRAPVNLHGLGSNDFKQTTVTGYLPAHTTVRNKNSVIPECLYRESSDFVTPNVAGSPTQTFGDDKFFLLFLFFKLRSLDKRILTKELMA